MPVANQYHFTTRWCLDGTTIEDVADVLAEPLNLPRWWPSVYLSAVELAPGGPKGLGRRIRLRTRGWLPYTLCWDLEVIESDYPRRSAIAASGDFEGTGVWTLAPRDGLVEATFDWQVTATKPLLRRWSAMLRPIFAANHRWAMRQGEKSLARELARRRPDHLSAKGRLPG
jgi:hypothetical protein